MGLLQYFEIPFGVLIVLGGFFAASMWLKRSIGLYLVLVFVFFLKFSRVGFRHRFQLRELSYSDLLFPFLLLAFMAVCYRYLEIGKYRLAFFPTDRSDPAPQVAGLAKPTRRFPSLWGGWWRIPVAVALALSLLVMIPVDSSTIREYWISPRGARAIFLGSFLFFVWFVVRGVIRLLMRRRMTTGQANVQIRSVYAREYWREQSGIEKRAARLRRKQEKQV